LFRRSAIALAAIAGALILLAPGRAHAQDKTLSGRWSATAMSVQWSIGDWGEACGPKPGGGGAPAGTVTVQQRGGELSMSGAGRSYSTTQCWEQFPGLAPVSHSGGKRGWSTVCKTGAGDPRQATVRTSLNASDDFIGLNETGQYQFVIKGQNCTASVRRTRTFKLIQREGEAAPAPASSAPPAKPEPAAKPEPKPTPTPTPTAAETRTRCTELGAPARLEVRPSRKLIRPGEEFEFQARVLDAAGCVLPSTPSWKIVGEAQGVSLTTPGKVRIASDAPETEVRISVSVAGRSVDVLVEIASSQRYDALLGRGDFNEAGESEEVAVTAIASGSIGAGSAAVEDRSGNRRRMFVAIVGGLALLLGAIGVVLVLRGKKRRAGPDPAGAAAAPARPAATPAPGTRVCPTCREEYPPDAQFCPIDGNRLVAAAEPGDLRAPAGGICPVCGQGFDPGIATCPVHEEELLPTAVYFATRESEPRIDRKICPVCGAQYSGPSGFCGTDGAALVPVN
jgi:hypothetical protein